MPGPDPFDPARYKEETRTDWQTAADGWRKWHDVVEAPKGGQHHSRTLVELAEIGPGDVVLDVAGGYGEPALTAARTVGPSGRVICTDLSSAMLEFGRERAADAGLDNVEFREGDAERLDFDPESFDAVLSRAGLMFLPDVAGTLRRLHGFLTPGGRLAASVWGPPPRVQFAAAGPVIVEELELPSPPADRPGAHALADPDDLAGLVSDAGFREVETGTLEVIFETESPSAYTEFIRDVAPRIDNLLADQSPEVRDRILKRVTATWEPFRTEDGRVRTVNEAVWVTGTR